MNNTRFDDLENDIKALGQKLYDTETRLIFKGWDLENKITILTSLVVINLVLCLLKHFSLWPK